jgi:hypothetical protein
VRERGRGQAERGDERQQRLGVCEEQVGAEPVAARRSGRVREPLEDVPERHHAHLHDGKLQVDDAPLQRPHQAVQVDGEPAVLFCTAAPKGRLDESYNVQIPLQP